MARQVNGSAAALRSGGVGDHEVHRYRHFLAIDGCGGHPCSGFVALALEARVAHQALQLRPIREDRWLQG